jgi:hypothetical protein
MEFLRDGKVLHSERYLPVFEIVETKYTVMNKVLKYRLGSSDSG